ncbi:MAG: TldD/PmbA family protein [Exilispira sp.]
MFFNINLIDIALKCKQYCEIRVQQNQEISIAILNGDIVGNNITTIKGISARSYCNGKWGFSSSSRISSDMAYELIKEAIDNAKLISKKNSSIKLPSKPFKYYFNYDEIQNILLNENQNIYIEYLKELDNYIYRNLKNIKSRLITFSQNILTKDLATSDGSVYNVLYPRSYINISLSIEKDTEPFELSESFGGIGRFSSNFANPSILFNKIDNLYENLIKKSEGIYPEASIKKCILDSSISGMLAHEAIGHTVEADSIIGGSIAKDYLNKEVASSLITIVDFAHHYSSKICDVPIFIDDEGTLAEDVVIIENGILKNYLNSKDNCMKLKQNLTGNARANLYNDEPIVRMRNTAILPGNSKLSDMISSIDDGYYLLKSSGGQADTNGEFMFSISYGYEIKKGKIGKAIKDTSISGSSFQLLKTVDMVSDDFTWDSSGFCGKKQPIAVSIGGPAIRCDVLIGGR